MRQATQLLAGVLVWVALTSAGATAAGAPPGAPKLRVARAADGRTQPSAFQEWWDIRVLDPRSHAMVALSFKRPPHESTDPSSLHVTGLGQDNVTLPDGFSTGSMTATASQLAVGTSSVAFSRHGAAVKLEGTDLAGGFTVRNTRRGPAALGFQLGEGRFNKLVVPRATLNWSMPIATGVARGSVDLRGKHVDLDGWLVSYEHTWGELIERDTAWTNWDNWLVHRGGETWIGFGLNRRDTVTGPGAREAMWLGLLARVGRRGVSICRPRIVRTHWVSSYHPESATAAHMAARCAKLRASFAETTQLHPAVDSSDFGGLTGPALLSGRGTGWVIHRTTSS
jgi:hypothetical protein